ncbi:MAG: hydrogenase expression/formation protein HypE [Anaerolineae bacterium]|nr:hydrogenase expression/formation protein HypE [Anaerolineae bacterium]
MSQSPDFDNWICPLPLRDYPQIVLGHGGGGKLSQDLVEHIVLPAFNNGALASLADGAALNIAGIRLAFSTDSYVVRPLFFPGGSIADLAVNGTVNDLAMLGAQPMFLSVGLIIEEGLPLSILGTVVEQMAAAARIAGVQIVTGDTKVVDKGHGDGLYINTSGIGLIPDGIQIAPQNARPGDSVLVSGMIGDHGMAVMSVREGLEFETLIISDSAPLNGMVAVLLAAVPEIHTLRDPTRGGVASSLNEIARAADVGIELEDNQLPIRPEVAAACELLGLDPLYVANEGKLIAILPAAQAERALESLRHHPLGKDAAIIGQVTAEHPGIVTTKTSIGGRRIVSMQVGEQLPRIC